MPKVVVASAALLDLPVGLDLNYIHLMMFVTVHTHISLQQLDLKMRNAETAVISFVELKESLLRNCQEHQHKER